MQNTRLNLLLSKWRDRAFDWLQNPLRRILLLLLGLFMGFFIASAISSTMGQLAIWDITAALFVVLGVEWISRWFYVYRPPQRDRPRRPFVVDLANALKVGVTYGLFLEAFKLNS